LDKQSLVSEINRLKKEKDAVIVAHNYQVDDVQEIADYVGDSLYLSRIAAEDKRSTIVFCGVNFMAESAKILSPHKTVLLPEIDAGCPMAEMITGEQIREFKAKHKDAAAVCYINSYADVKAECDICCTSSNAVKIVSEMPQKKILFVPDQNLGRFVASKVPDKEIIVWNGYCITHHRIELEDVRKAKEAQPDALLLVHPECQKEICDAADFIGSTSDIINFATKSEKNKFIIGTETGIMYKLKLNNPNKQFFLLTPRLVCSNMKRTSLTSVYNALLYGRYEIEVEEELRLKAKKSLDNMLAMSK
jgi:quinolinate synthase